MTFRLVPNSVTLDDLERRNSPIRSVISPNSVAFGTDCVKVVEDTVRLRHDILFRYLLCFFYCWSRDDLDIKRVRWCPVDVRDDTLSE